MSLRSISVVAALSLAAVAWPAMAQEPSLHDVFQATESGNFSQAQRMMDEVLSAHPNSAKAHYVEAELLAKQGRLPAAGAELATAERLDPGLAFAKPEAVRGLKAQIASRTPGGNGFSTTAPTSRVASPVAPLPAAQASIPWGMIIGGLLLIGVVVYAMRAMARRNAAATLIPGPGSTRYGAPAFGGAGPVGPQPYGPVGPQPYGGMPAAGGGLGSGLLGGLATGAALGAGMVAGEALAHRFTEGHHPDGASILPIPGDQQQYGVPNDMGGNDFGVADAGSWDDNSSGGVDNGGGDWT